MKKSKKISALIMTLVLCMASTITVWASEATVHVHTDCCTDIDSGATETVMQLRLESCPKCMTTMQYTTPTFAWVKDSFVFCIKVLANQDLLEYYIRTDYLLCPACNYQLKLGTTTLAERTTCYH